MKNFVILIILSLAMPVCALEDFNSPFTPDANTRALWHFDIGPGGATVFPDASTNENDGTVDSNLVTPDAIVVELDTQATWVSSKAGFGYCAKSWHNSDIDNNWGSLLVSQSAGHDSLGFASGTDMTLEFWMHPFTGDGGWGRRIIKKHTGGDYAVIYDLGVLHYGWYNSGWQGVSDTSTIAVNQWTHVAIVVDRTTSATEDYIYFFINGSLSTAHTTPHKGGNWNVEDLALFNDPFSPMYLARQFVGMLDEVRVSDCIRDYGNLIPPPPIPDVLQPDENTRGLWYFNHTAGDATVVDASDYNNDGTLVTGLANQLDPNTSWDSGQPGYNNCVKTGGSNLGPIEVPQSAGNDSLAFVPGEDMIIEFWMNPSAYASAGNGYLIMVKYTGGDYSVTFRDDSKLGFGWWGGGDWQSVIDVTTIPLNQWTQVAITVDRSSDGSNDYISFYINNSLSSAHTTPHKGGSYNTESLWILGRSDGHIDYCYRGKLDELKISDAFPDYLPPLEINWIKRVGDDIQFGFNSRINSYYKVFSADSPSGSWNEVKGVFGEAGATNVTVADALVGSNKQFYKVEKSTPPPIFLDVTSEAGISISSGSALSWGDYDNDGLMDFYKGTNGYSANVWRNNGGTFSVVQSGLAGTIGVWGDYDNDGDIDLFTWEDDPNSSKPRKLYRNDGGTFVDRGGDLGSMPATGIFDALWGDWDTDGDIDLYLTGSGGVDHICWNNGPPNWTFTVVARTISHDGRGVTAADYDGDNDPDIYVSCYVQSFASAYNQFLQNDGFGGFTDIAAALGVDGGMAHTVGSVWGDVDNDGDFDLLMANFSHSYNPRLEFFENDGVGNFTSRGEAGVGWIEEYINASFFDYDNDGDIDLYYTVFDYIASDDFNVLYSNNGNWTFSQVQLPPSMEDDSAYSAAWADYDNDGDVDLFTLSKLFKNETNVLRPDNHWLKVKLLGNGTTVNKDAIGAEARIYLGGGVILTRQVEGGAGGGWGNQNDSTLHFGLGDQGGPVDLLITWTDGSTQVINTSVDQKITIIQ